MRNSFLREPIRQLLETIVDNRGMTVPAADDGIPLIATNCIKETSLYPTFENIRYVSEETHRTWFRAHLQPEDILFVNKGTPGRVCMVPDPVSFCAAQDMIGLRADRSKVYPRYLFAFLRSDWVKEKIRNYHVGLAIPHFKKQDLDAITVPKRSDYEQKAIGDLYFLLSEKIELNNRINAELEGMAKLLYDYWFVQFDFPMTTAQAAALGKPHLTGHPYRASGGKMIYNETLKRDIPEGWAVKPLFDAMAVQYGFPFSTKKFTTEITDVPVIRIRDILENSISLYTTEQVDEKYRLEPLDLVIGMDGNFHMNFWDKDGSYLNQRSVRIRPRADSSISSFQAYFELSPYIKAREKNVSRTTVGHLSDKDLKRLHLLQTKGSKEFDPRKTFDSLLSKIIHSRAENQELTQLRDWLLPMLMNGQVTVAQDQG
jgi:type I restriction enzyme S subunit